MTDGQIKALMKGIAPILKEQLAKRDVQIAQLERRIADLEEQVTQP